MTLNPPNLKQKAAAQAITLVNNGMVLGLGTGSTTRIAVDLLGRKYQAGELRNLVGIPTSEATAAQARAYGIPLADLADYDAIDLAIDGADEVDPALNLTKGWGGALVREKLVETYARRLVIIVDETKLVHQLGTRGPLPVEVTPFGWRKQAAWLAEALSCQPARREADGQPYLTDNQNYILDCAFVGGIANPRQVQQLLAGRTGIVGHGLFLDMATDVLVATATHVEHLRRPK